VAPTFRSSLICVGFNSDLYLPDPGVGYSLPDCVTQAY